MFKNISDNRLQLFLYAFIAAGTAVASNEGPITFKSVLMAAVAAAIAIKGVLHIPNTNVTGTKVDEVTTTVSPVNTAQ